MNENDYQLYLKTIEPLERASNESSIALHTFSQSHKNSFGLTSDKVKNSEEYQTLRWNYLRAFNALKEYNKNVPTDFQRRRRDEKREHKRKLLNL